ncbi:MAG: GNAT family N-acetyltransferase [Acidobacteriota bacterium]
MNVDLSPAAPWPAPAPPAGATPVASTTLRTGTPAEAEAIWRLIDAHVAEGHLLARPLDEVRAHAPRFVVAENDGALVACAELLPLGRDVAEVRSLVVDRPARGVGLGGALIAELQRRARLEGFARLCAFTHEPAWFVRQGFSLVPHAWVPEKIARDCHACPLFRRCGQHAVILPLAEIRRLSPGV